VSDANPFGRPRAVRLDVAGQEPRRPRERPVESERLEPASARSPEDVPVESVALRAMDGADVLALFTRVWGPERDLAAEYPLLFRDRERRHNGTRVLELGALQRTPGRFVGLVVDGDVVSACGYLERELVTPFGQLRVALLGSVSTDPDWRGRGLASIVLAEAEAWARRSGCAATLLWPMDDRLYEANGYRAAACEWNVVLPTDLGLGDELPLRTALPSDAAALLALYDRHPVRTVRSVFEFALLLGCPNMDARVAVRDGEIVAYALRGRGGDLATCVHEWAGEPAAVLGLVSGFAREASGHEASGPLYLLAPDWSNAVTEALLDAGCAAVTRPLGMAKLADRGAAARFLAARIGASVVPLGDGVLVETPTGPRALTDAELVTALLPPENQGPQLADVASRLGTQPANLPAYAFAWGLDSI
jgi:GNAT superfamily N-acetyltransferase